MASSNLNIPITFTQLFELAKQLPTAQRKKLVQALQKENGDDIPEEHKVLVRSRIKKSKESELLDWDTVKEDFDGI